MYKFNFDIFFNRFFNGHSFLSFNNPVKTSFWQNINTSSFNFIQQAAFPIYYQQPIFANPSLGLYNNMDTFNFSNSIANSGKSDKVSKVSKPSVAKVTTEKTVQADQVLSTQDIQWWIDKGYSVEKGKKLCTAVKKHLDANPIMSNGKRRDRGQCVGYVRKGINDAFYGGKEQYKSFGKAYLCGQEYLKTDKNFKQITGVDLSQIDPADIPQGAVVLYARGYSNSAASQRCGHGEVSNGNGRGYSDCLTYLKNNNKQRIVEIWIPV